MARTARELADERRERIRSQERAELAAHVHDSVVQTLTLIQRNADDPREVTRLARAEERALRQWLYRPGAAQPGSFQAALEAAAADVEDVHGGAVEVVVVGDATIDERLAALVQAAREAMVNAAKYASDAGPVSVYAEVDPEQVQVFVRDRGPGFDLDAVPEDRLGVRQSIIGRMQRHGGRAEVVTSPGAGAEVRLSMPRSDAGGSTGPDGADQEQEGSMTESPAGRTARRAGRRPPDVPQRGAGRARATASTSSGRPPTSTRPSRRCSPRSRTWCCSTCTCPAGTAARCCGAAPTPA